MSTVAHDAANATPLTPEQIMSFHRRFTEARDIFDEARRHIAREAPTIAPPEFAWAGQRVRAVPGLAPDEYLLINVDRLAEQLRPARTSLLRVGRATPCDDDATPAP